MGENEIEKMEGILEMQADVIDEDVAQARMTQLANHVKKFLVDMENEKILANLNMEFQVYKVRAAPVHSVMVDEDTEIVALPAKTLDLLNQLYEVQKETVSTDLFKTDHYMRGLYNGMEVLMSTLHHRTPVFISEFGGFYSPVGSEDE